MSARDYLEKDYYAALGVPKDADAAQIKRAYRKLARQFHPDAHSGGKDAERSEERFKEVSEAYDVLSDADKRKEYDEARTLFGSGRFRAPGGMGGAGGQGVPFDLGDLFGDAARTGGGAGGAGGLGDLLGGLFGGAGRGRTSTSMRARRGADIETEVRLGFDDSLTGVTVPLRLTSEAACPACAGTGARAGTTPEVCPTCGGRGQTSRNAGGFAISEPCRTCHGRGLVVQDPCPVCHGSGRGMSSRTINVRLPAGVRDGQRVRIAGKGGPGESGGPAGDLFVVVHVDRHPVFGRKGDNVTLTLPVTFPEAALGAEVRVPTPDGTTVTLRLPPGTPNGRTFRVRGKGATRKDGSRADLLASVEITVPRTSDGAAGETLAAYRDATSEDDPRAGLVARAQSSKGARR